MVTYKFLVILGDGLIFGLLATGIYIAFQWLRFPDLTPDGSFILGASVYVKAAEAGVSPLLALSLSIGAGAIAGSCTAAVNRFVRVPTVVAGLLVSSALYSVTWLVLGRPNQFLDPIHTLIGNVSGTAGIGYLLLWLVLICSLVSAALVIFAGSMWGLRTRAIGENPLLANDLGISESRYTFLGLALANGIVGLAGALFTQRSFSADINMGVGITILGLTGLVLALLIAGNRRTVLVLLLCIFVASILHKGITFITLEFGLPAESFRLISALVLLVTFFLVRASSIEFFKSLKWS
jgi:putative tryptophan/tyrosine transport system permease protein